MIFQIHTEKLPDKYYFKNTGPDAFVYAVILHTVSLSHLGINNFSASAHHKYDGKRKYLGYQK